jgi:UDP-N-acetylmuramoyl-tripeptide--D-alanyl-D-alanine ligase
MLELGKYSTKEHEKVVRYIVQKNPDVAVFIGPEFGKILKDSKLNHQWFPTSSEARKWFAKQNVQGFSIILKGSRGIEVEKVLDL